ncbi:hypothetical protein [Escherichia coli]|uniref:hypothetical protein n=2 Tax=Escherichia coli TaxID=562 RepID=UPI0019B8DC9F|nr:hypothetical protein [Escherichia coli]HCP8213453.1 hypothetical protein [Escherichia coli]
MATPVEDRLVAPPEYIHEAPIPTTHIQYINKPAYNLVDFINDNIGIMTVLCFFILVMIIAWFFFRGNKENHAVECYDYSACLSTRKEYHLLTLVVVAPDTLPLLQLCQQIGDIIRQHGQQLVWMPGISRIDGIQEDNVTWALHSACLDEKSGEILSGRINPEGGYFFRPKESGGPETHQRLCLQIQYKSGKDIQFVTGLIERALHMMNCGYRAGGHIFRGEGYTWNMNGD